MGREIRKVPCDWEHPRDEEGRYRPLHDQDFATAAREWKAGLALWEAGKHESQVRFPEATAGLEFWEWDSGPPDPEYYRPAWPEESRTCLQVYETVSEGTPVSPVLPDKEAVVQWAIGQGHSEAAAREFAECGWVPSGVLIPGRGFAMGIDTLDLKERRGG